MFSTEGIVNYSEVNSDGFMTVDAIVDRFQNCTMLHSETVGYGIKNIDDREGWWVLSSWQVDIVRSPRYLDKIKVYTNPYSFKGVFGSRNFWIEDEQGEIICKANSIWGYIDRKTFAPTRIPQEEGMAYGDDSTKLDMEYMPRKIAIPGELKALEPVKVRASQLDTNKHVNNCEYIKTFIDLAQIEEIPQRMRAEYRAQAKLGDTFYPYMYRENGQCVMELRGENNEVFCIIEYIERQ